jgi:hypothetical protein
MCQRLQQELEAFEERDYRVHDEQDEGKDSVTLPATTVHKPQALRPGSAGRVTPEEAKVASSV